MMANHRTLSSWQEFKGLEEDGTGSTEEASTKASTNKREEFGRVEKFSGVPQSIHTSYRCFLVQDQNIFKNVW